VDYFGFKKVFSFAFSGMNIFLLIFLKDVFPDKATERKIFSFAIKCPSEGCKWTGELRNKEVIPISVTASV